MKIKPAFVALTYRGRELENTRTPLSEVTSTTDGPKVVWRAADVDIPNVSGTFDSIRLFNDEGDDLGTTAWALAAQPVTVLWPSNVLLVVEDGTLE